jgi:hypothetical protein
MSRTWLLILALGCGGDDKGGSDSAGGATTPSTTEEAPFVFATEDASAYTRVDRMGMPAISTAVIVSKDEYNQGSPAEDLTGDFGTEITTVVEALHTALDDDLVGLGLTPSKAADAVAAAAPLVIPDVLRIDTSAANGFPNGRQLTDPVIDLTLALVLLDLGTHGLDTLAGVPVNPSANDVEFYDTFPYLGATH